MIDGTGTAALVSGSSIYSNDCGMQIIDTLILRWKAQNIGLIPGCSIHEIEAAFAHLGCKVITDVVELYSKVGGMQEMENDAYWHLWSLADIAKRNTELSPYGVLLSDHLMDSWCYRLRHETDGRSSVYIDHFDQSKLPEKLFDGLEEFLISYAENPNTILG